MRDFKVDVAVLVVFFNRPQTLKKVFEIIKEAAPSRLYLYQDGPRDDHPGDKDAIDACRTIVEDIDWNCEVHKKYQEKNYGCDPSGYIAHTWAFQNEEKCIVLEDDAVPSVSFFKFCKELLDRYEYDTRISRISGMNLLEKYCPFDSDYFFSMSGSGSGWASWKRVIDQWDKNYQFLDDQKVVEALIKSYKGRGININQLIETSKLHKQSRKEYFESIFYSARCLNSGLTILPNVNMISNIGLDGNATHGASSLKQCVKGLQKIFYMKTYEIEDPIVHPKYIFDDITYTEKFNSILWPTNPIIKIYRRIEGIIRRRIYK